jgi:emp24/gp25L/p24 family/GOLD
VKYVKTKLFFSNEYYTLNETKKKEELQQFQRGALTDEQMKQVATESHFAPLKTRMKKISSIVNEIIAHQQWEREKEAQFSDKLQSLASSFKNMVWLQILVVVGSAAFSVINLRRFFVFKHIY